MIITIIIIIIITLFTVLSMSSCLVGEEDEAVQGL